MKEASRTFNVIISDLPDGTEEDELEFVVDVTKVKVTASLAIGDGRRIAIPREKIEIDMEEGIYIREI